MSARLHRKRTLHRRQADFQSAGNAGDGFTQGCFTAAAAVEAKECPQAQSVECSGASAQLKAKRTTVKREETS